MKAYSLSLSAKTLIITKAFEDAVAKGEGEYYEIYTRLMKDIPDLTVIRKTHATPRRYVAKSTGEVFCCNQFKNLTYANMEAFIDGLPNREEYRTAYDFLRNCGSLPLPSRYAAVRRWFTAQFPEFRKNPLFYLYNQVAVIDFTPFIEEEISRAEEARKAS